MKLSRKGGLASDSLLTFCSGEPEFEYGSTGNEPKDMSLNEFLAIRSEGLEHETFKDSLNDKPNDITESGRSVRESGRSVLKVGEPA